MSIKITFDKQTGRLYGGQIVGYDGVDKRIDGLALVIKHQGTVYDLMKVEQAYAPPFSSAKDPVAIAGYVAEDMITGKTNPVYWRELRDIEMENKFLLDVRTQDEFALGSLPGAVNIPLDELRDRMSDLPDSRRLCFVGQDIYKAGRVAGGLMSRCIPAGSQLLATVGNLKFDGHRQRLAGFRDRIREAGFPMEDLVVAETFNDYETTFRVVTEAIDRYPRLRGIYMANLSVSGCAAAIEQAGKKGAIRLICHDLNESVRQLLLRGSIDFTIPQNLRQQGYGPLILLRDVLRRKAVPDAARFNRQIDIVCSDNLP